MFEELHLPDQARLVQDPLRFINDFDRSALFFAGSCDVAPNRLRSMVPDLKTFGELLLSVDQQTYLPYGNEREADYLLLRYVSECLIVLNATKWVFGFSHVNDTFFPLFVDHRSDTTGFGWVLPLIEFTTNRPDNFGLQDALWRYIPTKD